jgi:hypothetical protein
MFVTTALAPPTTNGARFACTVTLSTVCALSARRSSFYFASPVPRMAKREETTSESTRHAPWAFSFRERTLTGVALRTMRFVMMKTS